MPGSLLLLTLMVALDPVRLGATLLMISRPRPLQNMFVYWIGGMTIGVTYMLVPLTLLHVTPFLRSLAQGLASPATFANATVRQVQIGIGVLVLSLAALMAHRFWARPRARLPTSGGATSTPVTESNTPTAISALLGSLAGCADEGRICNPAAIRPRPQCVGRRILLGRVGDRSFSWRRHLSRSSLY